MTHPLRSPVRRAVTLLVALALALTSAPGVDRALAQPAEDVAAASVVFLDVAPASTHATAIEALARSGIALGCAPQRFCPSQAITRAQMATLLVKTFGLATGQGDRFADVPRTSTHRASINAIAAAGVTEGCRAGRFCPEQQVSRAQLASFLARLLGIAPTGKHAAFADTAGNPHATAILAVVDAGIANGCTTTSFCGGDHVTRGQIASLLLRAGVATGVFELPPPKGADRTATSAQRLLYPDARIRAYRASMAGPGPFVATGDAGHGGPYSPGDGMRARTLATAFLQNPRASYWSQPGLPYGPGDDRPNSKEHTRPLSAAWVHMTEPGHPDRARLERELKTLLLAHATDPTLDYSNAKNYPLDFPGFGANPIFETAQWFTQMFKTRDMLGRQVFTAEENATLDQWLLGYANWTAHWLQDKVYGKALPGRLDRDYASVPSSWSKPTARSYDGGPAISMAALMYTNRHASVASAMSGAANYLAHNGYTGSTRSKPAYGVYRVDQLLHQSRLFVEETLRFSVYPQGFQGDFERGDPTRHKAMPQQGWLYAINVLANLMEIAGYHAGRGDMSVWDYGTTTGLAGSKGVPVAGGFKQKDLHFFAWSMSRYVNDGWGRTNQGQQLVKENFFHDVIPAAMANRFAPGDKLLEAAWRRSGEGFPAYPKSPQSQGSYTAHGGVGGKMIGLIEHTG